MVDASHYSSCQKARTSGYRRPPCSRDRACYGSCVRYDQSLSGLLCVRHRKPPCVRGQYRVEDTDKPVDHPCSLHPSTRLRLCWHLTPKNVKREAHISHRFRFSTACRLLGFLGDLSLYWRTACWPACARSLATLTSQLFRAPSPAPSCRGSPSVSQSQFAPVCFGGMPA